MAESILFCASRSSRTGAEPLHQSDRPDPWRPGFLTEQAGRRKNKIIKKTAPGRYLLQKAIIGNFLSIKNTRSDAHTEYHQVRFNAYLQNI